MAILLKILAVASLSVLPLSVSLWHKSHVAPEVYRYDVTPYKSLRISLKEGTCGLRLLDMPTRTALDCTFRNPLKYDPVPNQRLIWLSSMQQGRYRITWLVFPFWLTTGTLIFVGVTPFLHGPYRRWWRRRHGLCERCRYDLRGTRSRRCPECGQRFR